MLQQIVSCSAHRVLWCCFISFNSSLWLIFSVCFLSGSFKTIIIFFCSLLCFPSFHLQIKFILSCSNLPVNSFTVILQFLDYFQILNCIKSLIIVHYNCHLLIFTSPSIFHVMSTAVHSLLPTLNSNFSCLTRKQYLCKPSLELHDSFCFDAVS